LEEFGDTIPIPRFYAMPYIANKDRAGHTGMGKSLSRVVNITDLRELSRRRLPRAVFDYLDGGPDDEITLRDNRAAFQDIVFKPRHAVAIPSAILAQACWA